VTRCMRRFRGSLKGTGIMYLTTRRIVLVFSSHLASPVPGGFPVRAFDIPLAYVTEESFQQPIFGSNHLRGLVRPIEGMGLTAPCEWKIYFDEGGADATLGFFFTTMERMRRGDPSLASPGAASRFIESFGHRLPPSSDPAHIYYGQPVAAFPSDASVPVAPVLATHDAPAAAAAPTTRPPPPAPSAPPPTDSHAPAAAGGGGGGGGGAAGGGTASTTTTMSGLDIAL
jgi:hypothetical protein